MIVDLVEPEVTTVWFAFDALQDDHVEDTIIAAREWLERETRWNIWRFKSLHLDHEHGRIEIDFLRLEKC